MKKKIGWNWFIYIRSISENSIEIIFGPININFLKNLSHEKLFE